MMFVLLVFGLGTFARGVYALVTRDVVEDNERMTGRAAALHGAILIVIGLTLASHAIFHWQWITSTVEWLRQLGSQEISAPVGM
jgi:uncharacterized membrane protein YidH (DUF202 family)